MKHDLWQLNLAISPWFLTEPWEYDKELYKQRNQVERLFRRLKRFRRIFTRYDKLDVIFLSFVYFALVMDALM